ncbi:hypothetical protein PoB_003532300 [Plakobranchus ocellatus]|uniref:Uncharacterized protein n=1 Tax=Plakobranchus ocellatus TaxID=259542 RepID=A0AAV4AQH5_9GAST|nr:hypothetical protein PoB_003532300 [Plakobranchus ocellatus]
MSRISMRHETDNWLRHRIRLRFLYIASPQPGDLRLSGPPSGQSADGGARIRDRKVPANLRTDSLALCHRRPHRIRQTTLLDTG